MNIVTAITGASGALYAQRFLQGLVAAGVHVHLVVSPLGRRLLYDELGMETIDLPALAGAEQHTITLYNYNDVGAKLASGSFLHDGMRRGGRARHIRSDRRSGTAAARNRRGGALEPAGDAAVSNG